MSKNNTPEVESSTPHLDDFYARPEVYARTMKGMIEEGTLKAEDIDKSPGLIAIFDRIQANEAAIEADNEKLRQEQVETNGALQLAINIQAVLIKSPTEVISKLRGFAQAKGLELKLGSQLDTIIRDWSPDENCVLFCDGQFAVKCNTDSIELFKYYPLQGWGRAKE